MLILLTNDDGISAPGLLAVYRELIKLGEVHVVAPETVQSAAGHGITISKPLLTSRVTIDEGVVGTAVDGRPADCVKLAVSQMLPKPPDLVVSGINSGANVGINVLYSGTVAAAIEGAFYHQTAIAVSLEYDKKIYDFPKAAHYARAVIEQILGHNPPTGSLFNVNLPVLERGPIRGVKVLPQNATPYTEKFDRRVNPRGRTYFWAGPDFECPDPHPGTDVQALAESYITVTPLKFDLTDHARIEPMRTWEWKVE